MRNFLIYALLFIAPFASAQNLNTLYSEQVKVSNATATVVIEPGFKIQYIEIAAQVGQFEITNVEITNQYQDNLDLNHFKSMTGNSSSFGAGKIDKTGDAKLPGKVTLFIGNNTIVQKLKITIAKKVEGILQVSLQSGDAPTGSAPITPAPKPGTVAPTPVPTPQPAPVTPKPGTVVVPDIPVKPPVVQQPAPTPVKPVPTPTPAPKPVTPPAPTKPPVVKPVPTPAPAPVKPAPVVVAPAPVKPVPVPQPAPAPQNLCAPTLKSTKILNSLEERMSLMERMQMDLDNSFNSAQQNNIQQSMQTLKLEIEQILNDPNMKNHDFRTLEAGMILNDRRLYQTRIGSIYEATTNVMIEMLGKQFVASANREVTCQQVSTTSVISMATHFDEQIYKVKVGSHIERAYLNAADLMWSKTSDAFAREASAMKDYRDAEDRGFEFDRRSMQSRVGSKAESTYRNLTIQAFKLSENLLRAKVQTLSPNQRRQMGMSYDDMYRQSRPGSSIEAHALNMKLIALSF